MAANWRGYFCFGSKKAKLEGKCSSWVRGKVQAQPGGGGMRWFG